MALSSLAQAIKSLLRQLSEQKGRWGLSVRHSVLILHPGQLTNLVVSLFITEAFIRWSLPLIAGIAGACFPLWREVRLAH